MNSPYSFITPFKTSTGLTESQLIHNLRVEFDRLVRVYGGALQTIIDLQTMKWESGAFDTGIVGDYTMLMAPGGEWVVKARENKMPSASIEKCKSVIIFTRNALDNNKMLESVLALAALSASVSELEHDVYLYREHEVAIAQDYITEFNVIISMLKLCATTGVAGFLRKIGFINKFFQVRSVGAFFGRSFTTSIAGATINVTSNFSQQAGEMAYGIRTEFNGRKILYQFTADFSVSFFVSFLSSVVSDKISTLIQERWQLAVPAADFISSRLTTLIAGRLRDITKSFVMLAIDNADHPYAEVDIAKTLADQFNLPKLVLDQIRLN